MTEETRVQNASDDVASNIRQAPPGHVVEFGPVDSQRGVEGVEVDLRGRVERAALQVQHVRVLQAHEAVPAPRRQGLELLLVNDELTVASSRCL